MLSVKVWGYRLDLGLHFGLSVYCLTLGLGLGFGLGLGLGSWFSISVGARLFGKDLINTGLG